MRFERQQGVGEVAEQARPVEPGHLDGGVALRPVVGDDDVGRVVEGLVAHRAEALVGRPRDRRVSGESIAYHLADPLHARLFVHLIVREGADVEDVQRHLVVGGEYFRGPDGCLNGGTRRGDDGEKLVLVRRDERDLGDGRCRSHGSRRTRRLACPRPKAARGRARRRRRRGSSRAPRASRATRRALLGELPGGALGERVLRGGDARLARAAGVAGGDHRFGLVEQGLQESGLPPVPHVGADGGDVGLGEDLQQLQPLEALHLGREVLYRLGVRQVAGLRGDRHRQMLLDQPGDELGFGRREAEARTKPTRNAAAFDRVVLRPPFGDVVQEHRDVERAAIVHGRHEVRGEGVVVLHSPALDQRQQPDASG